MYMNCELVLCMSLIWVTGPSGAGKSTLGTFLRDKHKVVHNFIIFQDTEINALQVVFYSEKLGTWKFSCIWNLEKAVFVYLFI